MIIRYLPSDKIELSKVEEVVTAQPTVEVPAELAALQKLDWLDTSVGLQNSGAVDAYLPLLELFYKSLEEKANEIENFYATGDYTNYTIKVHAIKSSARIIGAVKFGEEAQLLENAGKRGDVEYIHEHHEKFMQTLRGFKEPLSQFFAVEESDKPEADAGLMVEVLAEIKSAANDMDCDRLQEIFSEMSDYRIPEDTAKLWAALSDATAKYDYESILNLLADEDSSDKPEADADLMADVFEEIKSAAEAKDIERIQDVIAELSDYRIPKDTAELWAEILTAIEKDDFSVVNDLLTRNKK